MIMKLKCQDTVSKGDIYKNGQDNQSNQENRQSQTRRTEKSRIESEWRQKGDCKKQEVRMDEEEL